METTLLPNGFQLVALYTAGNKLFDTAQVEFPLHLKRRQVPSTREHIMVWQRDKDAPPRYNWLAKFELAENLCPQLERLCSSVRLHYEERERKRKRGSKEKKRKAGSEEKERKRGDIERERKRGEVERQRKQGIKEQERKRAEAEQDRKRGEAERERKAAMSERVRKKSESERVRKNYGASGWKSRQGISEGDVVRKRDKKAAAKVGGERRTCTVYGCACSFRTEAGRLRHLGRVHRQNSHSCPVEGCDATGMSVVGLKRHISDSHPGISPYKCEFGMCGKEYTSKCNLRKHMKQWQHYLRDDADKGDDAHQEDDAGGYANEETKADDDLDGPGATK